MNLIYKLLAIFYNRATFAFACMFGGFLFMHVIERFWRNYDEARDQLQIGEDEKAHEDSRLVHAHSFD